MTIVSKLKKGKLKEEKKLIRNFNSKLSKCQKGYSASTLASRETRINVTLSRMRCGDVIIYAYLYIGKHKPVLFYRKIEKSINLNSELVNLFKKELEKFGFSARTEVYPDNVIAKTYTLYAHMDIYYNKR